MKRRDFLIQTACATGLVLSAAGSRGDSPAAGADQPQGDQLRGAAGPLRVHPANPRYFTDGSGRSIYLTGSHTWGSLQDGGVVDPPPAFDFTAYLDFLEKHEHNFIRLWRAEPTRASCGNHPVRYYPPSLNTTLFEPNPKRFSLSSPFANFWQPTLPVLDDPAAYSSIGAEVFLRQRSIAGVEKRFWPRTTAARRREHR